MITGTATAPITMRECTYHQGCVTLWLGDILYECPQCIRQRDQHHNERRSVLRRSNNALRGVITRLKNRLRRAALAYQKGYDDATGDACL